MGAGCSLFACSPARSTYLEAAVVGAYRAGLAIFSLQTLVIIGGV